MKLTPRSNQSTWSSLSIPRLSPSLLVLLLWQEKLNSPSRLCSSGLFFCQDAIYLEQLLEFLSRKLQFASSILSSDLVRNCISIIEYFNHNLNYLSGYSIVSGLLLNTIVVKFLDEDFKQIKTKPFVEVVIILFSFLLGSSFILLMNYFAVWSWFYYHKVDCRYF